VLAVLALPAAGAGCAGSFTDGESTGKITAQRMPTTLFLEPVAASAPCAATRLAIALGISRRGYYVLARPATLEQTQRVEVSCKEWKKDVEIWEGAASTSGSCVAPGILHVEAVVALRGQDGESAGPITFRGRQRIFPAPLSQGCRFDVEPEADLRKRAGEAIGWRFPPGSVGDPGADPRLIVAPPENGR